MSIDINEVSFKINENRWLEIWVGDQEIVSVDTEDGGLSVDPDAAEIGNIIENDDGYFEFKIDDEGQEPEKESEDVFKNIFLTLRKIENKL